MDKGKKNKLFKILKCSVGTLGQGGGNVNQGMFFFISRQLSYRQLEKGL